MIQKYLIVQNYNHVNNAYSDTPTFDGILLLVCFLFERDSHLPLSSSDLDHHELVQLLAKICAHSCGVDLSSCLGKILPCKYYRREVKTLEYMFGCMDTIRSKMSTHSSLNKEVVEDRIMNSKAGGKKTFTKWQVPSIVFSFAFPLLHQRPFNKV